MKVHKLQVGRINIIEHQSYEAFNECKRLKISIIKHKSTFGLCTHIASDRIYATNEKRKYILKRTYKLILSERVLEKMTKLLNKSKQCLIKKELHAWKVAFGNAKEHYLLNVNQELSY